MTELVTLLLVEDDPMDVELTLTGLKQHGLANEIVVVGKGEDALHFLHASGPYQSRAAGRPALVLLDLKLPGMDGLEVLQRIRKDAGLKRVPVVVMTSSIDQEDELSIRDLGVSAFLVKPVDFKSLLEILRQIGLYCAVVAEAP